VTCVTWGKLKVQADGAVSESAEDVIKMTVKKGMEHLSLSYQQHDQELGLQPQNTSLLRRPCTTAVKAV